MAKMTPEEIERFKARAVAREKEATERQAERELGLRLITIGSRALMKEAHPKLASSKKTVAMIKRARARLKANA
jgi:hypothetical protein